MTTSNNMHTPGPWMAQTVREQTGFRMVRTYVLDGAGGDPVACVQANGAAEEEANARLIAAAPELLEALKEAHRALMFYEWYNNPKSGWASSDNVTVRGMVDAAIAKATGEAA